MGFVSLILYGKRLKVDVRINRRDGWIGEKDGEVLELISDIF